MSSDQERLLDVLDAIEAVSKYAARGRAAFDADELAQTWIIHHLMLLGEAAAHRSDAFCEKHPDMPWFTITGRQNVLIHGYFAINKWIVRSAVQDDLPQLDPQIRTQLME